MRYECINITLFLSTTPYFSPLLSFVFWLKRYFGCLDVWKWKVIWNARMVGRMGVLLGGVVGISHTKIPIQISINT